MKLLLLFCSHLAVGAIAMGYSTMNFESQILESTEREPVTHNIIAPDLESLLPTKEKEINDVAQNKEPPSRELSDSVTRDYETENRQREVYSEESELLDKLTDEETIEKNEFDFDQQSGDSAEAWQLLHDAITTSDFPGITLNQIECREISCRLELITDSDENQNKFIHQVGTPPFDQGGFFYKDDEGKRLIVFANHRFQTL